MKTIGLVGGMSWESTAVYYRLINEGVKARLGGLHAARCVLYSVDFGEIEADRHIGGFPAIAPALVRAAQAVESAGAEVVLLCTNTMHILAGEIQASLHVPFLHIADATAAAIRARGFTKVGLLGTRFTMEEDFYVGRLVRQHGLDVLIPSAPERERVHRVIYDELCLGDLRPASRAAYRQTIERLAGQGAEGIILGCTEIGLLVKPEDSPVPLFDTTELHALAAVDEALRA
jgi:aspartate racemase